MDSRKTTPGHVSMLYCGQFCCLSVLLFGLPWRALAGASVPNDSAPCRDNLRAVFRAIQQYRAANHALPDRLSDLVPGQLSSANFLTCPSISTADDPKSKRAAAGATTAGQYMYEFETKPLTNEPGELGATLRSWRQWQMGKVGSGVPIVRCPNHEHVLNLSFGGEIYESGPDWEEHFSGVVKADDLRVEKFVQEQVRIEVMRIPARQSRTPPTLLDLTAFFNGSLMGWMESNSENLSELPSRQTHLGGVAFDVRGILQLKSHQYDSLQYPGAISNIAVGLRCQSLVFLQGASHAEVDGTEIGRYAIHFEGGQTEVCPIIYGQSVLDLRADPASKGIEPAWTGTPKGSSRKAAHLYIARWSNPHPELRVDHFDFVSSLALSSPFLVAVSVADGEPPGK